MRSYSLRPDSVGFTANLRARDERSATLMRTEVNQPLLAGLPKLDLESHITVPLSLTQKNTHIDLNNFRNILMVYEHSNGQ